jgi:hypothetical protein
MNDELTDRDREILAFEGNWWKYRGSKDEAVRRLFGVSGIRYEQLVNALIDRPEALVFAPSTAKRLRRLRNQRRQARRAS